MPLSAPRIPAASPSLDEELDIIQRAGRGDHAAYEWLYNRYVKKIYSLVFRIVGNANDAEEVTQEVFGQAYRGLSGFQGRSRFYTWIFRIATNLALQHAQKISRKRDKASLDEMMEKPGHGHFGASSTEDDPEKIVAQKEFLVQLETALSRLSPNHRAVMTLGPIMGHSYEEIGEILSLSPEVVKGRLHRARERVRELMKLHR